MRLTEMICIGPVSATLAANNCTSCSKSNKSLPERGSCAMGIGNAIINVMLA